MSSKVSDKALSLLAQLESQVSMFPMFNPKQSKLQKFGQYVTAIKSNQKDIVDTCIELREELTKEVS
jgi:hypothetical protein